MQDLYVNGEEILYLDDKLKVSQYDAPDDGYTVCIVSHLVSKPGLSSMQIANDYSALFADQTTKASGILFNFSRVSVVSPKVIIAQKQHAETRVKLPSSTKKVAFVIKNAVVRGVVNQLMKIYTKKGTTFNTFESLDSAWLWIRQL